MRDIPCVLPVGSTIRERYAVEDLLGKGGCGAVYLVRDMRDNLKPLVLKEVIVTRCRGGHAFSSQAALLRRLDHPALPRVHRVFSNGRGDRVYILVDYVEGPDLESERQLQPGKRFSLPQAMTLVAPIMHAVSYLHSQRPPLIHRDLKPSNIILPAGGPVLVDFGLAGAYDSETPSGAVSRGTPGYRAPTAYDGASSAQTDIYALGAILYLLLTGSPPADACERLKKLAGQEPDPVASADRVVPGVPAAVARAIRRALSLSGHDCYSSVEQFWEDLWKPSFADRAAYPVWEPEGAPPDQGRVGSAAGQPTVTLAEAGGAAQRAPALEGGEVFGRYRIGRRLGEGPLGESYQAEDSLIPGAVTLKLIHVRPGLPDAARRQFLREMQRLSALDHPYLAPVSDFGLIDGRLYVARRYAAGGSLLGPEGSHRFRPPLALSDAVRYGHQLAQVLQYIHDHGHVHGALTLSNILLPGGPEAQQEAGCAPLLLADAGLAIFARHFCEQQRAALPFTTAPEQAGGQVTPASDQFALAALLYFWLTGRTPYPGAPEEIERLELAGTVTPPSSLNTAVSAAQDSMLLRALSASPQDRYPSVLAFADALLGTLEVEVRAMAGAEHMGDEFLTSAKTPAAPEPGPPPEFGAVAPGADLVMGRRPPFHRSSKPGQRALILLMLFVTLLSGAGIGAGLWFYTTGGLGSTFTASPGGSRPAEPSTHAAVGPQPTAAATPDPVASPLPHLSQLYSGTLYDIPASLTARASLTSMRQQQGDLSGYLSLPENTLLSQMPRSGPLRGTVSTSGEVQFTLMDNSGQATFSFIGSIQSDKSIAGTYCSLQAATGKCSDYGLWSVSSSG